jgi:hypothetical protein
VATIEENREMWDKEWDDRGEVWSEAWGGVEAEWFGTILPRIHGCFPSPTILEIAPGRGRWTQFLKDHCEQLVLIDLSETCIRACEERFRATTHLRYFVNDGKSLDMIPDRSIDFVFSFDSLVHSDADIIEAYLAELSKKLKSGGLGFIHHSNIGSYRDEATGAFPDGFENPHWRGENMTARLFAEFCERLGLQCITQEIVNWHGDILNDCFSLFTRPTSAHDARPHQPFINPRFMQEVARIAHLHQLYTAPLAQTSLTEETMNAER